MSYPSFSAGDVLTATDMNAVGLWRITSGITATTTGSGSSATVTDGVVTVTGNATSVTISSAFSSTYDNYRIIINSMDSSAANTVARLTLSGSTGSTYVCGWQYQQYSTGTVTTQAGTATASGWPLGLGGTNDDNNIIIDLINPGIAKRTGFTFVQTKDDYWSYGGGQDTNAAASTGFTITQQATYTLTGGTIRVYGYRN